MKYEIKMCTATTPAIVGTVEATQDAIMKFLDEMFGSKYAIVIRQVDDDEV